MRPVPVACLRMHSSQSRFSMMESFEFRLDTGKVQKQTVLKAHYSEVMPRFNLPHNRSCGKKRSHDRWNWLGLRRGSFV